MTKARGRPNSRNHRNHHAQYNGRFVGAPCLPHVHPICRSVSFSGAPPSLQAHLQ